VEELSFPLMSARKLLIVEDDPSVRRGLTCLAESLGFTVTAAASLAEAACAVEDHENILLYVSLPDGSGIELLWQIRQRPRPVRVALYTAAVEDDRLRPLRELKPEAVIKKTDVEGLLRWLQTP
jgi:CheY-like chemotaxis protein